MGKNQSGPDTDREYAELSQASGVEVTLTHFMVISC